jgi:hypothetical protein
MYQKQCRYDAIEDLYVRLLVKLSKYCFKLTGWNPLFDGICLLCGKGLLLIPVPHRHSNATVVDLVVKSYVGNV